MDRSIVVALFLALAAVSAATAAEKPDLAHGIRQVDEGEFEAAVLTLDAVIRQLETRRDPDGGRTLAQAYLFLGIAYLGLEQPSSAKGKFQEAIRHDPSLRVGADRFPAKVVRLFDDARREAEAASRPPEKGGPPLILLAGGGAAVATAVGAVALGGGGSNGAPAPGPVEIPTGRVEVVSSTPAPGSTIAFDPAKLPVVVRMTLSVTFGLDVARGILLVDLLPTPSRCDMTGEAPVTNLVAGRASTVNIDVEFFGAPSCSPPFTTTIVQARLMDERFIELARQSSAATYHFVR